MSNDVLTWAPIVFCSFIWRTMKLMARTKPQEIKPGSKSSIRCVVAAQAPR
jgi:hypothetical protein